LVASPVLADRHDASGQAAPTAAAAAAFVERTEAELLDTMNKAARAEWVYANFITEDTAAISAAANAEFTETLVEKAQAAARFADVEGLDYDTARKLTLLRTGIVTPAPAAPGAAEKVAALKTEMEGIYGK